MTVGVIPDRLLGALTVSRRDQTMQQLDSWQWEPRIDNVIRTIFTPPVDDVADWYIEVGHLHDDDEHYDLLTIPTDSGNLELFFRPPYQPYHTDQSMRDTDQCSPALAYPQSQTRSSSHRYDHLLCRWARSAFRITG
jgi:hypothetical protein